MMRRSIMVLAGLVAALAGSSVSARARAGPAAATCLALVGAKMFRSPDQPAVEDAVILIKGDRIAKVGTRRSTRVPNGCRIVDKTGLSIVAGFWNSHVHLTTPVLLAPAAASDAELQRELQTDFTRWGFTTIFDLASTTSNASEIKARIGGGRVLGPRLLSVGEPFYPPGATPIYARPLYKAFNLPSAEIRSPRDAAARARAQLGAGDNGVKLFTGAIVGGGAEDVVHMRADAVRAITRAARSLGKPSFAHPTDRTGLEVAVRNGVGVLAHAAPLMGPWSPGYAKGIASKGVALVPTLSLFADAADSDTPIATALQQTTALHAAGGIVLFGTDVGFTSRFDTTTEMKLMHQALGWRGLLASLTTAPATRFGEGRLRGRIAPGYVADLVVLGGDPTADVASMSDVREVVRSGRTVFARPLHVAP